MTEDRKVRKLADAMVEKGLAVADEFHKGNLRKGKKMEILAQAYARAGNMLINRAWTLLEESGYEMYDMDQLLNKLEE